MSTHPLIPSSEAVQTTYRVLTSGRYDDLSGHVSAAAVVFIRSLYDDIKDTGAYGDLGELSQRFRNAADRISTSCIAGVVGLREAAALHIIATMGAALTHSEDQHCRRALSRLWFELAFLLEGRALRDGLGGVFMHLLMNDSAVPMRLYMRHSRDVFDVSLNDVRGAASVDRWLAAVATLAIPNESQFLTYSYLIGLGTDSPDQLERSAGVDLATCERHQNEHDEIAAHSLSPGVQQFMSSSDVFGSYMQQIRAVAAADGPRVARRRPQIDVARIIIPPCFVPAIIDALENNAPLA